MSYKNIQAQRITGLAAEIATVGGVTGSGTLNYIPKWTPSGIVVGNSQIFDNGTNVGIGTVLPTAKFNVEGGNDVTSLFQSNASSVTGYAGRFFANSVNTQSNVGIYVTASNGFQNYAIHADEGNSGFGGLDANSKIYVKGIDTTSSNYALRVDNSASSPLLYVRNDQKVSIGTSTIDAALRIQRNDVTKPALIIGNATGTDNFHYVNSVPNSYAWLDMLDGDMTVTSNYRIFHSMSTTGISQTYYNGSSNIRMKFSTIGIENRITTYDNSGNELFSIDSVSGQSLFRNANVGIGFSGYTATAKLHIQGIDSTSSNYGLKVDNSASSPLLYVRNDGIVSIGKTLQIQRYNYSGTQAFWMEANSIEDTEMNTLNADLIFKTKYSSGSNVESIRFTKEGIIKVADTSYISIGAYNVTTDKYGYLSSASNTTPGVGLKFEVCHIGGTTGMTAMQIDAGGNVGIGTASPTAKLHVQGTDSTSSYYALRVDNSSSSPLLYVRNDGNVGINTTNPANQLDIVNTVSNTVYPLWISSSRTDLTRILLNNAGAVQTDIQVSNFGGASAMYLQALSSGNIAIDNRAMGDLIFTTVGVEKVRFTATGNVGIGISSPTAKVHIQGADSTSGNYALKVDDSASSPLLYVRNDGNVGVGTSTPNTKVDIDGDFAHRSNGSAATISADTNDLSTSGRSFIRLNNTSGSSKNITGFANGYDGKRLVICNVSATDDIVIIHQDTNSSASNRIITGNLGANNTIKPDDTIEMIYDASTQRWRIINHSAG